ncbi:MAG TPA: helix-turn-helix domain-containing protein [Propionibacteriaceae bacterium]|nr:helix-turn-helix domain-containing protein [Propionibacteriaceae bacterium]
MSDSLEERVAALEQALQTLRPEPVKGPLRHAQGGASTGSGGIPTDPGLWLLHELRSRFPADAVAFGGTAMAPEGPVAWQWSVPTDQVREQDWEPAAGVLDALSHPVRLRLLQRVLNGTATTAELAESETLGTTGQLHHHLRALVAAGWLTSTGRGRWSIPGPRVIPLLVVIVAATTR